MKVNKIIHEIIKSKSLTSSKEISPRFRIVCKWNFSVIFQDFHLPIGFSFSLLFSVKHSSSKLPSSRKTVISTNFYDFSNFCSFFSKALKIFFYAFINFAGNKAEREKNYFWIVFHLIARRRHRGVMGGWEKKELFQRTLFSEFWTRSFGTLEAKLSMIPSECTKTQLKSSFCSLSSWTSIKANSSASKN